MDFWVLLAIGAQTLGAIGIFIDKYLLNEQSVEGESGVGRFSITSALCMGVSASLLFLVIVFIENGIGNAISFLAIDKTAIFLAIVVGMIEVFYLIPYLTALHETDEAIAPPLFQTVPIFGFGIGLYYGEVPTTIHIVGGLIILIGALVLNLQKIKIAKSHTEEKELFVLRKKPFFLMLFVSFLLALGGFLFKSASVESNNLAAIFWTMFGGFVSAFILLLIPNFKREFVNFAKSKSYKLYGMNLLNELVDNSTNIAYYSAIAYGPSTALVQSTEAYQPIILLLLAYFLSIFSKRIKKDHLHTKDKLIRWLGIMIIFFGSLFVFT